MKRFAQLRTWGVAAVAALAWAQGSAYADWTSEITSGNPLNWFRFDELSGTVANDLGSANLDGTYVGNVVLGSQGPAGYAAAFNGAGHVFLGGANLTSDWTLETLFKADTVAGGVSMGLIGANFAAASGRMALKAEQWESTGQMGYTLFGVVDVTFNGPAAATPTDFAHVVFVAQNSGVSLYVNGALAASDAAASPLSRWALATGAVRADGTLVDGLTGVIDEMVIYDRALSTTEISAHYTSVPEPTVLSLAVLGGLVILIRGRVGRR